jgi:hypothetical protein
MPEADASRQPTASERRRMYRDLALSLRCGLRDAAAGFSFLRLRGLRAILRALRSAADADDARLFRDTQAIRDLQGDVFHCRVSFFFLIDSVSPLPPLTVNHEKRLCGVQWCRCCSSTACARRTTTQW